MVIELGNKLSLKEILEIIYDLPLLKNTPRYENLDLTKMKTTVEKKEKVNIDKYKKIINKLNFDADTRGDNSPTTLLYGIALLKPRPLTPEEWVLMDLNINELASHYGSTPQEFVNMLYDSILTRVPDGSGQNYWTEQLTSGNFTSGQIVEHFIFSDELGKKTEAIIQKSNNNKVQKLRLKALVHLPL